MVLILPEGRRVLLPGSKAFWIRGIRQGRPTYQLRRIKNAGEGLACLSTIAHVAAVERFSAGSMARARYLGALTPSSALLSVAKDTRDPFPSVIRNQHPMKDDAFTGMT
jgi:hypothetical protein